MSVVVLTFTSSEKEITSGIPREVEISSNIPSIIYYTVDGTTPTESSTIYVSSINMPDNQTSVILSAFGVDADGYSGDILTQTFSANETKLDRTRNVGGEGLIVDRYDDTTDYVLAYDADGDAAAYTDIEDIDLQTRYSAEGRLGEAEGVREPVGDVGADATPNPNDDDFVPYSTTTDPYFNPYAMTIIVDGRVDQEVSVITRPFGSLRNMSREFLGQQELSGARSSVQSGRFIRAFYNAKTRIRCSYYWDANTARWVKSIQPMDDDIPSTIGNFNQTGQPLVFRWINFGRHSSIPI